VTYITCGYYISFLQEYQPIIIFVFMYFFYLISNTYSPYYNALISIVHNAIILFFIGFSFFNMIGIVIEFSVEVKLIVGSILGGICALSSPLLWRRSKIKREKGIFQRITKKKNLKQKDNAKYKNFDNNKLKNEDREKETENSNSSSLIRKRKTYNNDEESSSSKETETTSNSDEITTTSSNDKSNSNQISSQISSSKGSESTYSEKSEYDSIGSFERKLSKEELYESIETIGIYKHFYFILVL